MEGTSLKSCVPNTWGISDLAWFILLSQGGITTFRRINNATVSWVQLVARPSLPLGGGFSHRRCVLPHMGTLLQWHSTGPRVDVRVPSIPPCVLQKTERESLRFAGKEKQWRPSLFLFLGVVGIVSWFGNCSGLQSVSGTTQGACVTGHSKCTFLERRGYPEQGRIAYEQGPDVISCLSSHDIKCSGHSGDTWRGLTGKVLDEF